MTWVILVRASFVAAAIFTLTGLSPARAINVQPLALDMVSIGTGARGTIQIVNDSARALPVDVSISKLDIAEDGKTTETPAGDDFLIFPPQAVVPPGGTQIFRVQWVGEPDIKKSQTFMLSVNQLPVKRKAGETGVQMVFAFGAIVSVAPAGAQSALKLLNAEPATKDGKRGAEVTVENPSAMYAYFTDAKVTLESGGWRKTLAAGELREKLGYAVVLPGKRRRIFVPADVPAGASAITATLDYKPKTAK